MATRSNEHPVTPAKILLIDDNRHGLLARKTILEELGYQITAVQDPQDALDNIAAGAYDLVITDYRMPHMTGVELIGRIRALGSLVPVILVSGFVDILGLTEQNTGSDAVIQKSANEVQQLLRSVTRVLRKTLKKPAKSVRNNPPKARGRGAS